MQQKLNKHYAELCSELGDITARLELLKARQKELLAQIKTLNNITPTLLRINQETHLEQEKTKKEN